LAVRSGENIHKPQWLADSQEKLQIVVDLAEQHVAYFQEIYGAPCWGDADPEATKDVLQRLPVFGLPNGIAAQVSEAQKATLLTVLPEGVEPADSGCLCGALEPLRGLLGDLRHGRFSGLPGRCANRLTTLA
jgi:hypothetical protein